MLLGWVLPCGFEGVITKWVISVLFGVGVGLVFARKERGGFLWEVFLSRG